MDFGWERTRLRFGLVFEVPWAANPVRRDTTKGHRCSYYMDLSLLRASGLKIQDIREGTGAVVERGSRVTIHYRGFLNQGEPFG